VRRYVSGCHLADVAARDVAEISRVRLLRIFVPVRGERAPAARLLEAQPHASDPAEKINEAIVRHGTPATCTAISVAAVLLRNEHFELYLYHSAPRMAACAFVGIQRITPAQGCPRTRKNPRMHEREMDCACVHCLLSS
jgi:hypothetical protein